MRTNKKSILAGALAVVLATTLAIGGTTLAFLKGDTGNIINKFKSNQVKVELVETGAENGNKDYQIIPGTSAEKDPTVIVNTTLPAYVFVTVNDETNGLVDYEIADGWEKLEGVEETVYYREVEAGADQRFPVLKDNTVYYSPELTNEDMPENGVTLTFKAKAIQQVPFGSALDAWHEEVVTEVMTFEQLKAAVAEGGKIRLGNDIVVEETLVMNAGTDITLDMNGKKLTLKDATVDPMIDMKTGSSLVITGNGIVDLEDNYIVNFIIPCGDVTIENGTFLRDRSDDASKYGSYFVGINGGKGVLTINGGYFDGGYYKEGDCFENCRENLNLSWGQKVEVYGGTFVAQNPAWGDEGMAFLCDQCEHKTGYCQGTFLVGQDWHDTELPAGYEIVEGETEDGRPTYTVKYNAN